MVLMSLIKDPNEQKKIQNIYIKITKEQCMNQQRIKVQI
jgi:hypothetical protein